MLAFELPELLAQGAGERWQEFLRFPALSMGIYRLEAGSEDTQRPHGEDEVYYILSGRARFQCGDDVQDARPGTILFVARRDEHRFFDIAEDLAALVFFAPAEGSRKA